MSHFFRVIAFTCLALTLNGTSPARALTQREEIELGERVAREVIRKQGPVLPANSPAAQRVARIGVRFAHLSTRRGIPFSYRVLDDTRVLNAFAAPGGPIFITRRLVEWTRNDAELAAILGHETAHIEHRHMKQRVEKQEAAQKKIQRVGEKYLGASRARAHAVFLRGATNIAFNVWSLGYSRQNELEADETGTRWMSRLGYDPRAAVRNLSHLRGGKRTGTGERYLSTHPPTEEREQRLQTLVAREHLLQIAQENGGPRLNDAPAADVADSARSTIPRALPPPVPTAITPTELEKVEVAPVPTLEPVPVAPNPSVTPAPGASVAPPQLTPRNSAHKAETSPTVAPKLAPTGAPTLAPNGAANPKISPTPSTKTAPVNAPAVDIVETEKSARDAPAAPSLLWGWICLGVGVFALAGVGLVWQQGVWNVGSAAVPLPNTHTDGLNVRIRSADGDSWRIALKMNTRLTIGRENADILLDDPQVSAQHAEVRRVSHGVLLVDLESTNGTFLNQKRIGSTLWQLGETVRVGATLLSLESEIQSVL